MAQESLAAELGLPPIDQVGYVVRDLDAVLAAHAKSTRFRGIRQILGHTDDPDCTRRPDLLADPAWARGYARLAAHDLSFDLQAFPSQLSRMAAIAAACPEVPLVVCHTGFPYDRRTAADNNAQRVDHFLRRSQGIRRSGAATLELGYVACGRLDGFWERGLHPWDVAAATLIVNEAGGKVTDFKGGPEYLSGEYVVASNRRIHEEMLRVLREKERAPLPDLHV